MSPARKQPRRAYALAATAVAVLAGGVTAPSASACAPHHTGTLIIVGGGLKDGNAEVYNAIIAKAGGAGKARIGVITAAAVTPDQDPNAGDPNKADNSVFNGTYYSDLFKSYGAADAQWIPIDLEHIANSDDPAVVAQVESMTGFFFGGGDQYRYITTLLHGDAHTDSAVMAAIRRKFDTGALVAGSSAGAEIQSGTGMVTGGDSWHGLRDGAHPGYFDDATVLGYLPAGGFGFFDAGLIDTHVGTDGREGRAIRLAADTGHRRVYGLDENTALEVTDALSGHEALRVLGTHGVSVFDLSHARTGMASAQWAISGVDYSYLTDGDTIDPRSGRVTEAADKSTLQPADKTAQAPSTDIFYSLANDNGSPYQFSGTARDLADSARSASTTGSTFETAPRFTVTFTKDRRFRACTRDGHTDDSLLHLTIDIQSP